MSFLGDLFCNEQNSLYWYEPYSNQEYNSEDECFVKPPSPYPRWRKTPRTEADFSDSKSSGSSYDDADYEAWLENYHQELLYLASRPNEVVEKGVDTSDLIEKEVEEPLTSLFPAKKDVWFPSTKYWGPKDERRHWPIPPGKKGGYLLYPSIHPDLNLSSRYGRYHSLLNSAAAVPEIRHIRRVCIDFKKALDSMVHSSPKLVKMLYCDNLCSLKWFDYMRKACVIRSLCNFLRMQDKLEKISFENAELKRLEGIILLCALSRSGCSSLKELHMWKMFGYGQCPLLTNKLSSKGRRNASNVATKFFTKIHYLQILNNFASLTHLSMNYAYLANENGEALLCLKCIQTGCLKELRILCLKDERPYLTNPDYGVGGWLIPDWVWKRAAEWCPDLRVQFVFLNMPRYENVILFLSKPIPVSYVYLSSGMDFSFEHPWDIDSTLLQLRNWYSSTLETLSLHLWHQKDILDFAIKRKILEEFPNLLTFEFIGLLEDVDTLEVFCSQLSRGTYKLKYLLFWVEEEYTNRKKSKLTRERVSKIREKYHPRFQMPPFVSYILDDDQIILQGSFGQIWTILEERLRFSSQYMTETFNVGVLNFQNRRRDVLLHPAVISSSDVDKFDFTFPIDSTWYEVYLKDSDEINSSNSYVRNWSIGLWVCTGAMIFLFTVLLFIMLRLSQKFLRGDIYIVPTYERTFQLVQYFSYADNQFNLPKNWRKKKMENHKLKVIRERSLGNCFIDVLAAFCSQGVILHTNIVSLRILKLSILIFGMIMSNSYSALLISQLTLGERFLQFETLEEIPVKGQGYSLCVRSESYPYLYFTVNNSKTEIQPKWAKIVNRKPCPSNGAISLEDMCAPYLAFLETPSIMNENFLNNLNCKMTNLKKRYFEVDLSLLLLRGFEDKAKKELNMEILKYNEVGILSYLRERWI